jgi:hypothetical protein
MNPVLKFFLCLHLISAFFLHTRTHACTRKYALQSLNLRNLLALIEPGVNLIISKKTVQSESFSVLINYLFTHRKVHFPSVNMLSVKCQQRILIMLSRYRIIICNILTTIFLIDS